MLSGSNSGSRGRFLVGSAAGHDRCRRSSTHLKGDQNAPRRIYRQARKLGSFPLGGDCGVAVDQVVEVTGGEYEIVDFKSGRLHDNEGSLLPEATMQVRLYALAAEESTISPIRLFLEGGERHQVLWGRHERQETISLLQGVLSDLPQGVRASAPGLAMPGRQCAVCRVRPQCQRYIDEAPELWQDLEIAGHLPLDTWGRIVSVRQRGTLQDIELKDPNGDLVIVRGLDTARRVASLRPGDSIYLFGLERTEDRRLHGSVTRPRNFHELPPDSGQRLRRAQSLLVFGGVEGVAESATQAEELN